MSYSRNTEPARACKRLLVNAFTEAKTLLHAAKHQDQPCTLGDALRQRALSNEDNVPDGFFTTQIEFGKELYYWERIINVSLDSSAQIEISIGKCWPGYAKKFFSQALLERQRYRHCLSNGQIVEVWCYPIKYLPAFRRWLKEVYFVEKFPAYQQYRAKRVGAEAILILIGTRTTQRQISSKSIEQLPLFPVA
jgi:hypothetical protein